MSNNTTLQPKKHSSPSLLSKLAIVLTSLFLIWVLAALIYHYSEMENSRKTVLQSKLLVLMASDVHFDYDFGKNGFSRKYIGSNILYHKQYTELGYKLEIGALLFDSENTSDRVYYSINLDSLDAILTNQMMVFNSKKIKLKTYEELYDSLFAFIDNYRREVERRREIRGHITE